ncbi:RHS repeat-associated core domain-containing protein, partial [Streptomyces halstedii]|uniref:RHS repeat-associated core domain-containing protein n=1 Tax=Streptomyces halstedii TaxID=1944 RepID=UPI00345FCE3E
RNVDSASGDLAATTSKTGDTVLQLTTIHGDVALQLPLDTSKAPVALDSDEYGNPRTGQAATRYNWLGAKQRSAETLTGLTLMGVRLYNPVSGRFLSADPIYGGNANAYDYCYGEPLNCVDLDGRFAWVFWGSFSKKYDRNRIASFARKKNPKEWGQKNRKEHRRGSSKSTQQKHQNAGNHGGYKKRSKPGWRQFGQRVGSLRSWGWTTRRINVNRYSYRFRH